MTTPSSKKCPICKGEGWVCESHPNKAWKFGDGCCGGAGMPCKCNKVNPPWYFNENTIYGGINDQEIR